MLCQTAADLEVVAEAATGSDAVRLATDLRPDVVLMDLRMPGMDGIRATAAILATHPSTKVLALTTFDDDDHLYPALAAGAFGFLVKDTAPAQLIDAIRRAATGERSFSGDVLHRVVGSAVAARTSNTPEPSTPTTELRLTDRESEVLALVADGLSNAEIAQRLHIGLTTVKTHVTNLMAKTGATNRVRLAVIGLHAPNS
ncbi:response regulator [Nocardia sp. NPDC127526]|uniref:response regulator n=1 Tax=Nocardia sp. NPDC127526 TaxID=3345393 RepID=UPI003629C7E2